MKKLLLVFLAVSLMLCMLASCDDAGSGNADDGVEATVTLNGDSITISDTKAGVISGSDLKITKGGIYTISGTLNDGRITVEVNKELNVTLILNGASLTCLDSAPIFVRSAKNCYVQLADGTTNTIVDGTTYIYANALETEPNAAIFAKCDLFIEGNGTLQVTANYNNGIASNDDLKIKGGNIAVTASNHGLKGKDSVIIQGGALNITAIGDAIKSNEDADPAKGFVQIDGGSLTLKAGDEGLQAKTNILINGGSVNIEAESNGIKADIGVDIKGGAVKVTCGSDGIDSPSISGTATINGKSVTY